MQKSNVLDRKLRERDLLRQKLRILARGSLSRFILYTKPNYELKWFHELVCKELDLFERGITRKLMIFMPPQHGKSQISSIHYPAYRLGKNPDTKIAVCSYSADLASGFNRKCQQLIDDPLYEQLFPDSYLNTRNTSTDAQRASLRNSEKFELVGHSGFFKSVGVGGSLTGTPVDEGIIDDPFKDREEANSKRIRDKVWDWYTDVFLTRLHNHSKQLMLFTRWHEDDLAGRILKSDEAKTWKIISLPGLKEDNSNPNDPRAINEALWEERHSKEKLLTVKSTSPRTFASLYQQRPAPVEGDLLKKSSFGKISFADFKRLIGSTKTDMFADTAYTEKQQNDPSALMACVYFQNKLYIRKSETVRKKLPDLLKFIPSFAEENGYDNRSGIKIEPKASGLDVIHSFENSGYNVSKLPEPTTDKISRVNNILEFVEAGRCVLVEGTWNEQFLEECGAFPNGAHDDQVDNLTNAINFYSKKKWNAFIV